MLVLLCDQAVETLPLVVDGKVVTAAEAQGSRYVLEVVLREDLSIKRPIRVFRGAAAVASQARAGALPRPMP